MRVHVLCTDNTRIIIEFLETLVVKGGRATHRMFYHGAKGKGAIKQAITRNSHKIFPLISRSGWIGLGERHKTLSKNAKPSYFKSRQRQRRVLTTG